MAADISNRAGSLMRASFQGTVNPNGSNTVPPQSSTTSSKVSTSPTPEEGMLNYIAPHMAIVENDSRSDQSAAPSSVLLPPEIRNIPPSSSPGSVAAFEENSSCQLPRQSPWFDGVDYQTLYKEISHQVFDGYGCIEKDMVRPAYRIPINSVRAALQYLEGAISTVVPLAEEHFDSKYYVGFSQSELLGISQRHKGLTLGEAIQKLYMSRLHESNKLLPMTKVYEGGWSTAGPVEQQPNKAGTVWLGDVVDSVNIELLTAKNITAMVSLHPRDFRSKGQDKHGMNGEYVSSSPIRWHHQLELADSKEADMESELDKIFEFIKTHVVEEGQNLLIHCIAGLSRSVAVVRDFIQRIEVERGTVDTTGTAAERYSRMKTSRDATFDRLKSIRPGITEENFKQQLDNSTLKICGLPRRPKAGSSSGTKSKEHGGGGYIGDSVALVFFFYRLRPTPRVIELFEKRRMDHARKEKGMGQMRNGFSFPAQLIRWYEDCIQYLSFAP